MTYFAVQTRKQEVIEQRIAELERLQAREKLTLSQKALSGVLYERGIDGQGFARILSKGDAALFGGYTTGDMKQKLAVPRSEEHTYEIQSLMRSSYAVFYLTKNTHFLYSIIH